MKIKILAWVFAAVLTAVTLFAVLDTFVISRVYQVDTSDADMFRQSEAALAGAKASQENAKADESMLSQENADAGPAAEQADAAEPAEKEDPENADAAEELPENIEPENAVQEDAVQKEETDEDRAAEENDRMERNDNARRSSSSGDSNNTEETDNDGSNGWNRSDDSNDNDSDGDNNDGDNGGSNGWNWSDNSNNNDGDNSGSNGWNRSDDSNDDGDNGESNGWNRSDDSNDDNDGGSNGWNRSDNSDDDDNNDNNTRWGNRSGDDTGWNWYSSYSTAGSTILSDPDQDHWEYTDDNIRITINKYEIDDSAVYAADIQLSSAEYLKSAFADNHYGRNVTAATSAIAADHNAILAINGDYYGAREEGYVIRNGVVYRDKADDSMVLCIYADGSMEIVDPANVTAQQLVEQGVWQAYSFGPALVENGEVTVTSTPSSRSDRAWGWGSTESSNPRTAIGLLGPLHYLFVVSDGRTDSSEGLTLPELAEFMQSMGVTTAYNLDGGGSSTMVFQGEVINRPTTTGAVINERSVSDIVYIG